MVCLVNGGVFDTTIGELYAIKKYKNLNKEDQFANYIKGKLAVALEKDVPEKKLVSYIPRFPEASF